MASGILKFFNQAKGYGFITPEAGGDDVFVHISDLHSSGITDIVDGMALDYELGDSRNGRSKAVDLSVVLVE